MRLLAPFALLALAAQRPASFDFAKADADGDGKLSLKEASAGIFASADADRSGFLAREEIKAIRFPFPPRYGTGKPGTGVDRLLQDVDHDRDGKVSEKEFQLPPMLWRLLDRDRSGFVTEDEIRARRPERGLELRSVEEALERMDRDRDGSVSREEWRGPAPIFDRWDSDKDGVLSSAELKTGIERAKAAGIIAEPADFLRRYDANQDGKVTLEEFGGPADAFRRADTNGDGVVTAADRPKD
jgi:Ca2+-binding EF-hand superfamily protein